MDGRPPDRPHPVDYAALAILSAGTLAFEILLLRVFSYSQWHHFASLAVALALMGFGASGATLVVLGERAKRWGGRLFSGAILLAAGGMLLVFLLNQRLSVRPLFVFWHWPELVRLLVLDFAAFVPFYGAGLAAGQVFVRWPEATRRLYAANMLGSGLGSVGAVLLLIWMPLEAGLLLIPALLLATSALHALAPIGRLDDSGRRKPRAPVIGWAALIGAVGLAGWMLLFPLPTLHVSDFKRLAYLLDLPDAQVVRRAHGLRATATEVRSKSIRIAPGLSLQWTRVVPAQDALALDADRVVPLPRLDDSSLDRVDYLRASLGAVPYALRSGGRVAVLGIGEGLGIFQARLGGASRVTWVEPNPLIRETFASRGLDRFADEIVSDETARFLKTDDRHFDLIVLDGVAGGGDALTEDPLLTRQTLAAAFDRIAPAGYLVIPIGLHHPPRAFPKLVRLIEAGLATSGVERPADHVLAMRELRMGLVCVGRNPISIEDQAAFRAFATEWGFDLAWMPRMSREEANQFHQLTAPLYFDTARAILVGDRAPPAENDYFNQTPATDARPYFWHTIRWRALPRMISDMGRQGLAYVDWGPLMLVVALVVAAALAVVLILAPLGRIPAGHAPLTRPRVLLYFSALGLGYLLLEMAAFQRCTVLLGHPIPAAAIVFSTFLVSSGLGSLQAPEAELTHPRIRPFGLVIAGWVLALVMAWSVLGRLLAMPEWVQVFILIASLAPLGWAMGQPFPWGLRQLDPLPRMIPWAWGINGFASVLAGPLAAIISVQMGQPVTWIAGAFCYLVAWRVASSWLRSTKGPS